MYSTTTYQALDYFSKNILELEGILLAITSLFVYFLYKEARKDLKQEVKKIAKEESEKVKEKAIQQLLMAFAHTWREIAVHTWIKHKKRELVLTEKDREKIDKDYLNGMTIDNLREVLKIIEEIFSPSEYKDFWENKQNKSTILSIKNNLAWFISWKENPTPEEKKEALKMAKELHKEIKSQEIPNYHYLDTVAWVFRQFPLTEEDREESYKILNQLKQRTDIPQIEKDYLLGKYKLKNE